MRLYKQIIFILIIFLKTETVLSNNNLFNVNNILLEKNGKITNTELANTAIKNGFIILIFFLHLNKLIDLKKYASLEFLLYFLRVLTMMY